MNTNQVTRHYGLLTPEERFRLILAASGRGDEAERDRLVRTGQKIHLTMADHAPNSQAFSEIGMMTYLELLEVSNRFMESFDRADQVDDDLADKKRRADTTADAMPNEQPAADAGDADEEDIDVRAAAADDEGDEGSDVSDEQAADDEAEKEAKPLGFSERWLRIAFASGFVLRNKVDGWKLFCERLHVPAFLLWECLPGYQRLQAAIDLAARAAFTETGFVCWLNETREPGTPECTQSPLTAAGIADGTERDYRERSRWWSGITAAQG